MFHVFLGGETDLTAARLRCLAAMDHAPSPDAHSPDLSEFDRGFLVGLLVGEGSFGGDGKQPQVTLRMHTRHLAIFEWLTERFPRSRLYGPYHHGGRSYYQWMARGRVLVEDLLPVLETDLTPQLDGHAAGRLSEMTVKYRSFIERERARSQSPR